MKLADLFAEGRFVVTGEVGPPKGVRADAAIEGAQQMAEVVDAVNVTDNQSAVMRLGSLAVCCLLEEKGVEPVFQLTCRDRNRIGLQSDLLSAAALGVENVLAITGDHMALGDHPEAKKVFDLDSVQLLAAARTLREGADLAGHELESAPDYCLGAVVNPGSDELETQLIKMEKKIEAGAEFFQTQAVFEPELFSRFMARAGAFGVPVMVGVVPLKSAGMARFMTRNIAGVRVPEEMVKHMADTPRRDRRKAAVDLSAGLIREMRDLCQGIHIMPLGWDDLVADIVHAAEIV